MCGCVKHPRAANTERGCWIYAPAVLEHTRGIGVAHALTLRQGNGARWKQVPAAAQPACCCPCALSGSMGLSHWVFSIKKRGTFVPLCAGSSSYSRRALRFCYEHLLYAETTRSARVAPLHCPILCVCKSLKNFCGYPVILLLRERPLQDTIKHLFTAFANKAGRLFFRCLCVFET